MLAPSDIVGDDNEDTWHINAMNGGGNSRSNQQACQLEIS